MKQDEILSAQARLDTVSNEIDGKHMQNVLYLYTTWHNAYRLCMCILRIYIYAYIYIVCIYIYKVYIYIYYVHIHDYLHEYVSMSTWPVCILDCGWSAIRKWWLVVWSRTNACDLDFDFTMGWILLTIFDPICHTSKWLPSGKLSHWKWTMKVYRWFTRWIAPFPVANC
jgi:hypothetical protein